MEAAISLLEFEENDEHCLKVSEEAITTIKNLPTTYGIKTTAVVGPGRIGKSSLLNWLVGKNVFEIGSKTDRVTRGIWMYIDQNDDTQLANVYLDVEGFGDPSKSNVAKNDNRLLNIVAQICDVVLYNIRGVYDRDMLDKIIFVCSLFNQYRKENAVLEKPILVSVLRDFDLDPPDCPDKEFKNLFRKEPALLDTFRKTKAFTLSRPKYGRVIDLTNTADTDLCKEFVQERNQIKKYLAENTMPLRAAKNKTITGIVLADNIRRTVKHVNNDNLGMLLKSLPEILKETNDKTVKSALDTYKTNMSKNWPKTSTPETLMELHEKEKNVALQYIDRKCFTFSGSVEIDEQTIKDEIENMLEGMQKDKCEEALERAVFELKQNFNRDVYYEDDGLERFLSDLYIAENTYTECRNLGPMKLDIWQKYIEGLKTKKENIKQTALVRDIAAATEKKNKEMIEMIKKEREKLEKLTKEREKPEVKSKELERSQENGQMLQGVLDTGKCLVELGRGATEIYSIISSIHSQWSGENKDTPSVSGARSSSPTASLPGASSESSSEVSATRALLRVLPLVAGIYLGGRPLGGASSESSSKGPQSMSPTASSKDPEL